MTSTNVRGCLRRAYEEIEDVCDTDQLSDAHENRLSGIAKQLRYYVEGDPRDPEAVARPDPGTLDTMRDHLGGIASEVEGDTAVRLERARDEVLAAVSVLEDHQEKQRRPRNPPG